MNEEPTRGRHARALIATAGLLLVAGAGILSASRERAVSDAPPTPDPEKQAYYDRIEAWFQAGRLASPGPRLTAEEAYAQVGPLPTEVVFPGTPAGAGLDWPSTRRSPRRTADACGRRARWGGGVRSSSRFPLLASDGLTGPRLPSTG